MASSSSSNSISSTANNHDDHRGQCSHCDVRRVAPWHRYEASLALTLTLTPSPSLTLPHSYRHDTVSSYIAAHADGSRMLVVKEELGSGLILGNALGVGVTIRVMVRVTVRIEI